MREELLNAKAGAAKAFGEILVVLACQQRRRHGDGDLATLHRRRIGGAQRDLRLAEADIAAHEPVHRLAARHVRTARRRCCATGRRFPATGSGRKIPDSRRWRAIEHRPSAALRSAAIFSKPSAMIIRSFLTRALRACQPAPPSLSSWVPLSSPPKRERTSMFSTGTNRRSEPA